MVAELVELVQVLEMPNTEDKFWDIAKRKLVRSIDESHHRLGGSLAVAAHFLGRFSAGLQLGGYIDRHPGDGKKGR